MLVASRLQNREQHNIAVIGDGAMTAGMAFEALNHAGHIDDNVIVVLNGHMSISKTSVACPATLRAWASKPYNFIRGSKRCFQKFLPH